MYRKLIFKTSHRFVPLGANLALFLSKSDNLAVGCVCPDSEIFMGVARSLSGRGEFKVKQKQTKLEMLEYETMIRLW